jgi:peptidyl-prolyl cis-trans isomerase SurA
MHSSRRLLVPVVVALLQGAAADRIEAQTQPPPVAAPAATQEPSRRQTLDRVVAVSGSRPILLSEVLEDINAARAQGQPMPPDSAGQMAMMLRIINELIDNEVVIQVAKQYKADATDEDVAKQVDDRFNEAKKRFGSDAEFRDALRRDGFGTPEDYRRTLRDQAKRYRLQQLGYDSLKAHGKLSAPVQVTEAEVNTAFENAKGRLPKRPATVSFRQIVIAPRPSEPARLAGLAKAESLHVEVRNGADFASVAKRESMDPASRELGGDLGWARRGVMVPEFERAIFDPRLIPGALLPVIQTSFGFHVIRVERIQPAEVKSRHILIIPKIDSADVARTKILADSVLQKWSSGTSSFDSLSAKYHDRAEERSIPDGFPVDSLPEIYKVAMEGVPARGFTKPFEIPDPRTGQPKIAVIQVLERAEGGDYTVADYKDRIRTQLTQEKQIRRMLDQLRREQYVRIMIEDLAPAAKKVVP